MSSPKPNVYIPASELIELGLCPFRDERFDIEIHEPCPICGMLGTETEDDKCMDRNRKE